MVSRLPRTSRFFIEFLASFILGVLLVIAMTGMTTKFESSDSFKAHRFFHKKLIFDKKLSPEGKILCLVFTFPLTHRTKAIHVKNTWGKRCSKLLFVTTKPDPEFDTILVNLTSESRTGLCNKTRDVFLKVHDLYLNDFDWFFKSDDDR